jgi:hypothetical protein
MNNFSREVIACVDASLVRFFAKDLEGRNAEQDYIQTLAHQPITNRLTGRAMHLYFTKSERAVIAEESFSRGDLFGLFGFLEENKVAHLKRLYGYTDS